MPENVDSSRVRQGGISTCRHQVHPPANRLPYRGRADLVLLYIDSAALDLTRALGAGRLPDPRSMLFPHLYGPPAGARCDWGRRLPTAG